MHRAALPMLRVPYQNIPIRMKKPTSIRNVVDMMVTVRNTSPAEKGFMTASHLAKPCDGMQMGSKAFGSGRGRCERAALPHFKSFDRQS